MIAGNSNCSRIDAVKAAARQLQMQLDQEPRSNPESDGVRKARTELDALQAQIKNGKAQPAETALSTATDAVQQAQTQPAPPPRGRRGVDAYA
jgi:hypothetical protein